MITSIKVFLILFFATLAMPSFSQKVTKKVSKEICGCFDKIDLKGPTSTVEEQAQECILKGIVDHADELVKEYKLDPNDESAGEKIGEELGKVLVAECPKATDVFTIMGSPGEEEK